MEGFLVSQRQCRVVEAAHATGIQPSWNHDIVSPGREQYFRPSRRTALQPWFYAIFLFVTMRHGVSGNELQRTLGVTYKTAWRMGQQIRVLMGNAESFSMVQGHVELDGAYVGGRRPGKRGRGADGKTIVFGMKERDGRMTTEVILNVKKATLRDATLRNVDPINAYSYLWEVYAAVSRRVYFPVEPPRDAECDV